MCKILGLLFGLAICGFFFDYNLTIYFGKNIPWYGDCVAGFLTAPINIPAAVIGYFLDAGAAGTPLLG